MSKLCILSLLRNTAVGFVERRWVVRLFFFNIMKTKEPMFVKMILSVKIPFHVFWGFLLLVTFWFLNNIFEVYKWLWRIFVGVKRPCRLKLHSRNRTIPVYWILSTATLTPLSYWTLKRECLPFVRKFRRKISVKWYWYFVWHRKEERDWVVPFTKYR